MQGQISMPPPEGGHNSAKAVRNFPFPFISDNYMYSANVEPSGVPVDNGAGGSWGEGIIDVNEHYFEEIAERERILSEDPDRFVALPHMMEAQWDALEFIMETLVKDYPEHFSLHREGDDWRWENRLLGIEEEFTFGDASTLPYEPLEYIGRQVQEDLPLLDQRAGQLFVDAGLLTFPADWSMAFDAGMSFQEIHGPVPRANQMGVFTRAEKFLMNVKVDAPYRRTNWTLTVGPRMDTSTEKYHEWGPDRSKVTFDNVGEVVHLRVEVQNFVRLPRSNGVMFVIHTYLLSMNDLVTVPNWARRTHRVLRDLPDDLVDYKGFSRYRDTVVQWLAAYDDGEEVA